MGEGIKKTYIHTRLLGQNQVMITMLSTDRNVELCWSNVYLGTTELFALFYSFAVSPSRKDVVIAASL